MVVVVEGEKRRNRARDSRARDSRARNSRARGGGGLGCFYSSMAELDTEGVQVRLCDVQYSIPRVETLIDERVEVLRDAQLAKDTLKRSHIGYLARVPPR